VRIRSACSSVSAHRPFIPGASSPNSSRARPKGAKPLPVSLAMWSQTIRDVPGARVRTAAMAWRAAVALIWWGRCGPGRGRVKQARDARGLTAIGCVPACPPGAERWPRP